MIKNGEYVKVSFAGANTCRGFVSFYDSIFSEDKLDGLYIIKGGPGTGKSTFMKRLGNIAKKEELFSEQYLCGSDATSLDGIIINGKNGGKVGVIDGTPPHPREFRCPGAAGDILNFGMFWNSRNLRSVRHEIDMLAREKQLCYDTAYRYLGAVGKIDSHINDMCQKAYLTEKGHAAAKRLVDSVGAGGVCSYRQLKGYTMYGEVSQRPVMGETREFVITGDRDVAGIFLRDVETLIKEEGIWAEISLSPLDLRKVDSIYFPSSDVWLHTYDGDDIQPEKVMNMQRFTDKKVAGEYRQRLRFGKKCRETLLSGAMESLSGARKHHFALEEIYKEHMDFDALKSQSSLWYSEILGRLD